MVQESCVTQTQTSNCVEAADNFHHIRIWPSKALTELAVLVWDLIGLSNVDFVLFAFCNHRAYAIDELEVFFCLPEFVLGCIFLIRRPEGSKCLHVIRLEDANIGDEACETPGGEGTAREAETENLISLVVVIDEEIVGLKHVDDKAVPSTAMSRPLKQGQGSSTYSRVVVDNLLPLLAFSVLPCFSNRACQSCDVGRYVAST